ncbi:BTAD domain-containing putative transcriptional regulator [Actinoplanes sp. CA-030573]|uniref:AfsR/SARP family transcriptional regulator n=1 Tax=Actinoplanes sp. CA-030573 TaxID=3239898 RepID=UPI003D8C66D2
MRYRILGPLSVGADGAPVAVASGRDRVVLAMLLLDPDGVVSLGELVDAVWGEDPPSTARSQLQACVSRLRRVLPPEAIATDPAGYRLRVGPDELDSLVFARLTAEARAGGDAALLRRALDLWRGPALVEIDSPAVRRAAAVLDEHRAAATEDWVDLELGAGRERELVGELSGLVERFPLRERLRGQLMVALYRSGRQADALAEYRRAREVLRDELGIEPGRELRDLHQQILTGRLPDVESTTSRVRCLPRTVGDFTGRDDEVSRLVGAIDHAESGCPVIAVIDGMAGSGKTTLALHVAALVGDRYPDAHLFVDLHGHSAEQPIGPAEALLVLLRQLGVDPERIPSSFVDRVGLWRTELSRRRALVLFDNVAFSAQLADLLPTTPGSLALVTSRRRLAGLDGVHPESLDVLAEREAVALLARIAGDRIEAEPEAALEVVRRCGGLPLALRLAGARLAHRPRWRVADLLRRLGASALPELAAEDRSVADAFAVSYSQLPPGPQRVFRLLGLYPGADFDAPAVAGLTGLPIDDARDALDDLVDVHLVEEPEPEVYRLHDLLREFAAALAAELGEEQRHEALVGLLDQQLHAAIATTAGGVRMNLDRDLRSPAPLRPDLVEALDDPAARLERERRNLPLFLDAAIAAGRPEYAWQIPRAAWRYLWTRGYIDDVASLYRTALAVTQQAGDRWAIATVANYLASAHYRRAEVDEAIALLELSIRIREEIGDRDGVSIGLGNLAGMHYQAGRWRKAMELVLIGERHASNRRGGAESNTRLNLLALCSVCLGNIDDAIRYYRLRLLAQSELSDMTQLVDSLLNLAVLKHRIGVLHVDKALRQIELALRLYERVRYSYGAADGQDEVARMLRIEGRLDEAVDRHRQAIALALSNHDPHQESRFRCSFGFTLLALGDRSAAREMFEEAFRLAHQMRLPYPAAQARIGLGDCADDPGEARRFWELARDTFAELGAPELADVERRLAALRGDQGGADQLQPATERGTMVS